MGRCGSSSRPKKIALIRQLLLQRVGAPTTLIVDRLFDDFDQANSPGAAVIVIKDGNALFLKAYGLADLETKIP